MRWSAVFLPIVLGTLLAGCGNEDEVGTPKVLKDFERPASDTRTDSQMNPPAADNGSGLGTASGAGTAPNPTDTAD